MSRLMLFLWNASEARERAAQLRRSGHTVRTYTDGKGDFRDPVAKPTDAFVIDLGHLPTHGREIGGWLRRQKATRSVPLVFVGGEAEKIKQTRSLLPDATFTAWRGIRGAIKRALTAPPEKPAVPGAMAGYSGTPLPRKLGIKAGSRVALLGAPKDLSTTLGALPDGVILARRAGGSADLVMLFAQSRADLHKRYASAVRTMADGGSLWIAWPKQASGVATDLTQNDVRAQGIDNGLVDYKICAIDATWSGLKFARRKDGK